MQSERRSLRPLLFADLEQEAADPGDAEGIEEQGGAEDQVGDIEQDRVDQQVETDLAVQEDRAHALEDRRRGQGSIFSVSTGL